MNGNVKIIDNTLQVVSFQQVRMGWIPGFSQISEKDDIFALDNKGILYINADNKFADEYVKWIKIVKNIPQRQFNTEKGFVKFLNAIADDEVNEFTLARKIQWKDAMKKAWVAACGYETERRKIRKQFFKKNWKAILVGTIKRMLKGGE